MIYSEAFACYGAKLRNIQWAVSTIHEDQLIVSCWQHKFTSLGNRTLAYEDRLSRISGSGNKLLREHLETAFKDKLPVRVVIAKSSNPAAVDAGEDASKHKNTFSVKKNWLGEISEFDGDFFRILFREST
jgi:hypothetical protein